MDLLEMANLLMRNNPTVSLYGIISAIKERSATYGNVSIRTHEISLAIVI